jgi:hypothetical protein
MKTIISLEAATMTELATQLTKVVNAGGEVISQVVPVVSADKGSYVAILVSLTEAQLKKLGLSEETA